MDFFRKWDDFTAGFKRRLTVAIIGSGEMATHLARAYADHPRADLIGITDNNREATAGLAESCGVKVYRDIDDVLADPSIAAVEIALPLAERTKVALAAIKKGKHVSLLAPPAADLDGADELLYAARGAGVTYRVFDPICYYPPVIKAAKLLRSDHIGELQMIRLRVISGGHGGWWGLSENEIPTATPEPEKPVFNSGFYRFGLAVYLMGAVENVFARIRPESVESTGASMVMWKHNYPDRFGFMEIVRSPEFFVRSKVEPRDDHIEINGSDGNLWITRFAGQTCEQPALRVLRGSVETNYGGALKIERNDCFGAAAEDFVRCCLKKKVPQIDGALARNALAFALAAEQSSLKFEAVDVV
jgi:predicted dehydrogenase